MPACQDRVPKPRLRDETVRARARRLPPAAPCLEGIAFVGDAAGAVLPAGSRRTGEAGAAFAGLGGARRGRRPLRSGRSLRPRPRPRALSGAHDRQGLAARHRGRRPGVGVPPPVRRPGAERPAPPWGSVYTDRDCVVFGESTLALRDLDARPAASRALADDTHPRGPHRPHARALMAWVARNQPAGAGRLPAPAPAARGRRTSWAELAEDVAEQPFYRGPCPPGAGQPRGHPVASAPSTVAYPRFYR